MASCCSRWIRLSPEGDGSSGRLGMGRGPVVLPVRIGTCLWLLGRQLCLRSHHDGADGNPSLYRGLAAFAHRKPAPAGSASQFRQFALVHRVKMSSRNARFRDQHSARKMTEFRAQSRLLWRASGVAKRRSKPRIAASTPRATQAAFKRRHLL